MITSNHTVNITRGNDYGTTVATGVSVYIYDLSDELAPAYDGDGGQTERKMITNSSDADLGDKLVDENGTVYIVRKKIYRESKFKRFYEYMIRTDND